MSAVVIGRRIIISFLFSCYFTLCFFRLLERYVLEEHREWMPLFVVVVVGSSIAPQFRLQSTPISNRLDSNRRNPINRSSIRKRVSSPVELSSCKYIQYVLYQIHYRKTPYSTYDVNTKRKCHMERHMVQCVRTPVYSTPYVWARSAATRIENC